MGLQAMLRDLQRMDLEIEALNEERSSITWELERLATVWDKRYPVESRRRPWERRLCCTAGRFEFDRFEDGPDGAVLRFGTRCSYDGNNAASGVVINAAWFERALADLEKTEDGVTT